MQLERRRALQVAGLGVAGLAIGGRAWGAQPAKGTPGAPAAKPEAPQVAGFYRFKIGSLDAIAVNDGSFSVPGIQPLFAPEASPEELRKVLSDAQEPTDAVTADFNVLCVKIGAETVLFDAGFGTGEGSAGGKLLPNLAAAGVRPESITAVILSHAHGDHLYGLVDPAGKLAFPNARVFVNRVEHDFWTGPTPDLSGVRLPDEAKAGWIAGGRRVFGAIKPKLELVKPGDKILGGIELLDGRGHTPGHMPAIISDGSAQLVAMADLAHNPVLMFAHPEWTVAFDSDPKLAVESRRRLFDRFSADRVRLFGYHMPWPALGRIGRHGEGYWWARESWKW